MAEKRKSSSPPRQVLELVADRLDPQTLATAACVCESWSASMSADHIWRPFCSAAFPSLSNLNPAVPYSKLYSLGRAAEERSRLKPPKPQISMSNLIFAFNVVKNSDERRVATVIKSGAGIMPEKRGLFRFAVDVSDVDKTVAFEAADDLRIIWNVALEGFKGVFTVMDCKGKGSFVLGLEGWFSKELPAAAWSCSSGGGESGLVADVRLQMREEGGRTVVEKISVGLLSVVSWNYVCVDDGLRYLQYFLLPSDNNY